MLRAPDGVLTPDRALITIVARPFSASPLHLPCAYAFQAAPPVPCAIEYPLRSVPQIRKQACQTFTTRVVVVILGGGFAQRNY